jgi:LysM repeat protein
MRSVTLILFILLALFGLVFVLSPAGNQAVAQGQNLLTNPSFEGQYSSYVPETPQELADCPRNICTTAQMPPGWKPWWVKERPTDVNPEYKPAEANVGGNRIHSGSRAAQYFSFWSTHKAGLRQTVTVPAGSLVQFSVFGQAWMTEADNASVSDRSGTPNMRIGIDPTGGTNPYSPNVVWSGYQQPFDAYAQFSVQAQAQGDKVTVFTFSAPSVNPNSPEYGFKHNDIYWDDAALVVVGAGSVPAAPPASGGGGEDPAPVAAAPQQYVPGPTPTPDADGIIYVEVQAGDSMWAVAARAGLTIDELVELNDMSSSDVLRPGDRLIIGRGDPPSAEPEASETEAAAAESPVEDVEATPETEATPEPTAEAVAEISQEAEATSEVAVCLKAYDDMDGNGVQDAGDTLNPAVAFTISDGQSVVSNYVTDGESEPFCVTLPGPGSYRVTRSVKPNEVLTTPGDRAVSLSEGSTLNLEFGSYMDDQAVAAVKDAGQETANTADSQPAAEESNSLLTVAIIAAAVVAVLLLLAIIAIIVNNRRANAAESGEN